MARKNSTDSTNLLPTSSRRIRKTAVWKRGSAPVSKESLGRLGILLLPSLKMKSVSPRGKSYEQEVHDFLVTNFSGYTVASGNIAGFWKDSHGQQHYGEHLEYRVGFLSEGKIPMLEHYIAELATELGEKSIFWATGEDAWLIYRKGRNDDE